VLNQLVDYAVKHNLNSNIAFTNKNVRWAIVVSKNKYIGVIQLNPSWIVVPTGNPRAQGDFKCHFLVESLDVVTGYKSSQKSESKRDFFYQLLDMASKSIPELSCIEHVVEKNNHAIVRFLEDSRAKNTDTVTFIIDEDLMVTDSRVISWWNQQYNVYHKQSTSKMIDCVTGQTINPAMLHGDIKASSFGGNGTGSKLASFNKDVFCSYGLNHNDQGLNSPMSSETATRYASAINDMLHRYKTYSFINRARTSAILSWVDDGSENLLAMSVFTGFDTQDDDSDLEDVVVAPVSEQLEVKKRNILNAIYSGKRPENIFDKSRYCAILLSANAARVIVNRWYSGETITLFDNVVRWFDDQRVISPYRIFEHPYAMSQIVGSIFPIADSEKLSTSIEAELIDCAFNCRRLSSQIATKCIGVIRSSIYKLNAKEQKTKMAARQNYHVCHGLLKMFFNREWEGNPTMLFSETVNVNHPLPAYHCGRLLAVIEHVQNKAVGDVGANVIDKFYPSASCYPGMVFGQIISNTMNHLSKIAKDSGGLKKWYQQQLQEITIKIGGEFPKTLDTMGQGVFALGYFQQRADLFTKKNVDSNVSDDDSDGNDSN